MKEKKEQIKRILRTIGIAVAVLLAALLALFLIGNRHALYAVFTADDPAAAMDAFLHGRKLLGVVILIAVQVLQVILAFIPGGPMQMVAGALFGGLLGGLLLLLGSFLASLIIWQMVTKLGAAAIEAFHGSEQPGRLKKLRAFREEKSAEAITWILFLIPGVPKDLLTYFAPLTPMKRNRFLLISTVARIPGVFLTTFASSTLMEGQGWVSVILYIVMFGAAAAGGLYYKKLHRDSERTDN